jgi:predicted transcriptional regulator with HTH domain
MQIHKISEFQIPSVRKFIYGNRQIRVNIYHKALYFTAVNINIISDVVIDDPMDLIGLLKGVVSRINSRSEFL